MITLPYEPVCPCFVLPRERSKQEHIHCEAVDAKIQKSHDKPTLGIGDIRVQNQEEEWNRIVSELDQRSWDK